MNAKVPLSLGKLKQLLAISIEMYSYAEQNEWDSVSECDDRRLEILNKQADNDTAADDLSASQILKDKILDFDVRIQKLASSERKLIVNKEIRQQAQVAAQISYKKALHKGPGL